MLSLSLYFALCSTSIKNSVDAKDASCYRYLFFITGSSSEETREHNFAEKSKDFLQKVMSPMFERQLLSKSGYPYHTFYKSS